MRIHILPLGFTPDVFVNPTGPLIKVGADKIITIHGKYPNEDIKKQVEQTWTKIKETIGNISSENVILDCNSFTDYVRELIKVLNRFAPGDEVYLHIGGGERHLGIALVYASFFSKNKIMLLPVLEYSTEPTRFVFSQIGSIRPVELTPSQKKILALVMEREGQLLKEIAERVNPQNPQAIAPGVLRHLRKLADYNIVDFDPQKKRYYATELAPLFLSLP